MLDLLSLRCPIRHRIESQEGTWTYKPEVREKGPNEDTYLRILSVYLIGQI